MQRRLRFSYLSSWMFVVHAVAIGVIACAIDLNASANEGQAAPLKSFVQNRCADCHSGKEADGGFDVAKLTTNLSDSRTLDRWVRIFDRVQKGEMPPRDHDPLPENERSTFLEESKRWIDAFHRSEYDTHGRVRGRRLTNLQLERSLQDILGIDIPLVPEMSVEPRAGEFTTFADNQSMSHFQLEQHVRIVDMSLDELFRRATVLGDDQWSKDFSAKDISRRQSRCREPEFIDGMSVVWSGQLIFYGRMPATEATESGWYRITFPVQALKQPKEHGVWCSVRTGECVASAPLLGWVGSFEATEEVKEVTFNLWLPKGHMIEIRPHDRTLKQAKFAGGQVANGEGGAQNVPGIGIHGLRMERIHLGPNQQEIQKSLFAGLRFKEIEFKTSSDRTVRKLKMYPKDADTDLARLMTSFATRAFRRPVETSEIEAYIGFAKQAYSDSGDFQDALRTGYRALLCSPRFLYFQEQPGKLDDYAIATRLSYFIWNSTPDAELVRVASEGKLHDRDELKKQVGRMLSTHRGKSFMADFASQWLELSQIDFTDPDAKLYPQFDLVVQNAMLEETHHFLDHLLDANAPVEKLINANFSYLNSRLARYYDLDAPASDAFEKVVFHPSDRRGGLLTQGSILKVTANGTNTSPVIRGVWICNRILGDTIPPPPESVPAIEPDIRGATTIREQLEKHRSDAACASCHSIMDGPGFALENFDAAGQWRDKYLSLQNGKLRPGPAIDIAYRLGDGSEFDDFNEFKSLVSSKPDKLARNFAEKLIAYGTGEPITFADRVDIAKIVDEASVNQFGLRSIIEAVVASETFTSK